MKREKELEELKERIEKLEKNNEIINKNVENLKYTLLMSYAFTLNPSKINPSDIMQSDLIDNNGELQN